MPGRWYDLRMSAKSDTDRTLAFAGMLQALQLVQSTAYGKPYDADAFQASLSSILAVDAGSTAEVYGGSKGVSEWGQAGSRFLAPTCRAEDRLRGWGSLTTGGDHRSRNGMRNRI